MPSVPLLTLGSVSPRRRELLEQAGYRFRVHAPEVEEVRRPGEAPAEFVTRVALSKARATAASLREAAAGPVLAADTIVVLDGDVLGKPRDRADGLTMLARLSGRDHQVLTAVALLSGGSESCRLSRSRVVLRRLSAAECEAYWETGEPAGKAGSYAIQGRAAMFVQRLEGSYSGVVGLPLYELGELLREAGFDPVEFWRRAP